MGIVPKQYELVGSDGKPYKSFKKGRLGGHRRGKIYGRLDCPSALSWIEKGYYISHRVFFLTEEDAKAAGYRACKVCKPSEK